MRIPSKHADNRSASRKWIAELLIIPAAFFATQAQAQTPSPAHGTDALHQLNDSVEALVQRVSPSVVQIVVSGYGSTEDPGQGQMSVVIGGSA